jgi:hypothetical protein
MSEYFRKSSFLYFEPFCKNWFYLKNGQIALSERYFSLEIDHIGYLKIRELHADFKDINIP